MLIDVSESREQGRTNLNMSEVTSSMLRTESTGHQFDTVFFVSSTGIN